ncbi:hypothetical protein SY88_14305 [Clostridiales bacterium PH28_bin88]|nr:hypothetical protein SY88_14305 [Clostridiales bacterium PH28_bin88]
MLSQMDVALIKNHLMDHQAGINKLSVYLGQTRDPQVAQTLQQQRQILQNHYGIMLDLLQRGGAQPGTTPTI